MHNVDDFKAMISKSTGMARNNLYLVQLPKITNKNGQDILSGIDLNVICKSTMLPGRQILTHDRHVGQQMSHIAYGHAVQDITLTFHVMNDYKVKEYFEVWQSMAVDNQTFDVGYYKDYAKPVVIKQLKKGLSLPIYKNNLGFLDDVSSNIKNRLPNIQIPGLGGVDLRQGEVDIGLITNDQVMYECKLKGAFPTSITSIDLADANANGTVELTVAMSYTNWYNEHYAEGAGLAYDLARVGTFLDELGIPGVSGIF